MPNAARQRSPLRERRLTDEKTAQLIELRG
jgi:hypothetical protein